MWKLSLNRNHNYKTNILIFETLSWFINLYSGRYVYNMCDSITVMTIKKYKKIFKVYLNRNGFKHVGANHLFFFCLVQYIKINLPFSIFLKMMETFKKIKFTFSKIYFEKQSTLLKIYEMFRNLHCLMMN